nr:hypothetical protein [Hassalia byssoidea]
MSSCSMAFSCMSARSRRLRSIVFPAGDCWGGYAKERSKLCLCQFEQVTQLTDEDARVGTRLV